MKKIVLITIVISSFFACNAQDKKEDSTLKNEPKEKWSVNKKVDENGNITHYDSTYSWTYSTQDGNLSTVNLDSIMNSFDDFFKHKSPFNWNQDFSFFPSNDSLLMENFFKQDYFFDQWKQKNFNIERMIQQMDSTRNEFLKRTYPGLTEPKEEN
jgi:hypothetical protein